LPGQIILKRKKIGKKLRGLGEVKRKTSRAHFHVQFFLIRSFSLLANCGHIGFLALFSAAANAAASSSSWAGSSSSSWPNAGGFCGPYFHPHFAGWLKS